MTPPGNTFGSLSVSTMTMPRAQRAAQITFPATIFIPPLASASLPLSSTR